MAFFNSYEVESFPLICYLFVNPSHNNHYKWMNHLGAWIYLTTKYAELRPWGRAELCLIALFTADWMPNQQVIVGVHSRFVEMLFGSGTWFKHCCQSSGSQLSTSTPDVFKLWESQSPNMLCNARLLYSLNCHSFFIYNHLKVMMWQFIPLMP